MKKKKREVKRGYREGWRERNREGEGRRGSGDINADRGGRETGMRRGLQ